MSSMFLQFSPVKTKTQPKVVKKEKESEKDEVLSLAPFTPNPKLFFEDIKVGDTVSRKLRIDNPSSQDVNILVSHNFPDELNVVLNWTETTITRDSSAFLIVTWCPLKEVSLRYTITVHGKGIHRDVPVAFKSLVPKKTKSGTKRKQKTPSVRKTSPTKKYYSTKPPNVSPKRFSPPRRRSPTKKYSPSPGKKYLTVKPELAPTSQRLRSYANSPKSSNMPKEAMSVKENIPLHLLNASRGSPTFVSPSNATFHLDYLQPTERRETYVVNGKQKSPIFDDSLEDSLSPISSPHSLHVSYTSYTGKSPLGISNRDNIPATPPTYDFEYKLMHLRTFSFSPTVSGKQFENFSQSTIKHLPGTPEMAGTTRIISEENKTFEIAQSSPNISSDTYVKSNISTETYVKDNASFETYVKGNVSGGTYTKDSSVGDIANLSISPVLPKTLSITHNPPMDHSYSDSARQIIEANLWLGTKSRPLSSIKEESCIQHSMTEGGEDLTQKSFLKCKSNFDITFTPPKKPDASSGPKEWSRKGGTAFRVAKKTTGLNLQFVNNNNKITENDKEVTVITKKDTNTIVIQNPFLLAATDSLDPFMTPHLCISEEWMDQQQVDFKKWLNALLKCPEELSLEEQVIDVAKIWQECKNREVEAAPTKEEVSNRYHTNNKLNSLRKSAQNLFRTKEMSAALSKAMSAVEMGKLAIREDKDIHLNLMLKSEIMTMLLSYNPLWLRIGLETIYNEKIPLKSNSDITGLSTFIATRLLKDPFLLKKHKSVHSRKYVVDLKKFFLKKFLVLVYFLDQAKNKKLIPHDPCLFCKKASVKESKQMLTTLAKDMVAAVGDITKYLRHIDYVVSHVQTYIHEFDYAVNNLGVDLRDGVRLTKLMEIILLRDDLTTNLRVPAISRLQKIHNMKIVFSSLENAGYKILYDITPKDIVDGHKEKTLSFLWQIIYKFQAPLMVKSVTTIQTWFRSLPVVLKRNKLRKIREEREDAAKKIQTWYRRQKLSKKLYTYSLLLRAYLEKLRLEKAAIKLQSYYRMHHCRRLYTLQLSTVVNIQRLAKGWLVRNVYRQRIKSAVVIQKNVRMYLARKKYLELKRAASAVQVRYRANRAMRKTREAYVEFRNAAIVIQRRIRAKRIARIERNMYEKAVIIQKDVKMYLARKRYLKLRKAVSNIQARYRANRLMNKDRAAYIELRNATVIIQRRFKARRLAVMEKNTYKELRSATISIQQRFRANKLCRIEHQRFLQIKVATIRIQTWYRSLIVMRTCRQEYITLKKTVVIVEHRYLALRAMQSQRKNYQDLKRSCTLIQQRYRAQRQMRVQRMQYLDLKAKTVVIQQRYRAKKEMERQKLYYETLRSSTIFIQRRFRANKVMKSARDSYVTMKTSAIRIQRWFRATMEMRKCRTRYASLKRAVLTVEARYEAKKLMEAQRNSYQGLKSAAIAIQRRFRANKAMKSARDSYVTKKTSTIKIQRWFRATLEMRKCRTRYVSLKRAVLTVEARYKAKRLMEVQRNSYQSLKSTAVTIQRRYRALVAMRQKRTEYLKLRATTIFVQRKYRATKVADLQRREYLRLKEATVLLQNRYRAQKSMQKARKAYLELRKSVIIVQRRFKANMLMRSARNYYQQLLKSTRMIQQRFRANKAMLTCKERYGRLRNAVIVIQQRWRAKKIGDVHQHRYQKLRNAAVIIQRRWRANKLAQQERTRYMALRQAALFVQNKWRAKRLAKLEKAAVTIQSRWKAKNLAVKQRNSFLELVRATVVLQRRWRAKELGKLQLNQYEELKKATVSIQRRWRLKKLGERDRNAFVILRTAIVNVQRRWRARKLMVMEVQRYKSLKWAVSIVQNRFRATIVMRQQRRWYIEVRTSAITIQRYYRGYLTMKKERGEFEIKRKVVVTMQKYIRGYLVRRRFADYFTPEAREKRRIEKLEKLAATKIQATWRGYKSRSLDTSEMLQIRQRAHNANNNAKSQNTLGSRSSVALQALVNEKSTVFIINKSLEDLDFITRHSGDVCARFAHFLPRQMYLMIKATNRSLPEMQACMLSVNILINMYKYAPTRPHSFVADYIDDIITVMLHWCDKDVQLFPSMCTLLWLFAHVPKWKRHIKSLPNIQQRLSKIQSQVARKDSMVRKAGVKGQSVFMPFKTLPLPSCEPDWGLECKDRPYVFTNSVHAFSSLLRILDL